MLGNEIYDALVSAGEIEEDEIIAYVDYNNMPIWAEENARYDILGVYHSEDTATIVLAPLD